MFSDTEQISRDFIVVLKRVKANLLNIQLQGVEINCIFSNFCFRNTINVRTVE
jgi:hypothetical protein